ncbi:MAG: UDP-2,3-diacylglucosamine diphosphatase [Bacteroidaceae bacterium]|nr:UDP-2,3-diacylglucosamine diphosphatase [Bacteroidaceae bacterium]MBO7660540.1 UDP-2,3-diacylglucosamine diphosphatase [Bacteroidaceae bacterium]
MKNYYFISDAHLGSRAFKHARTRERRLVNFLDAIKDKAEAVYMLGDMFDFWFEYDEVVPRGFTRFLGKVSELTDRGVEVHFFQGNHDMWCGDYLEKECGMIIHKEALTTEICGKEFYIAHGHRLDYRDHSFKARLMYDMFESRTLRRIARMIHPHWFMNFGLNWAKSSREKHIEQGGEPPYQGEDKEGLVLYAKEYLKTHPTINYFMFGHRHIELDMFLNRTCRMMILGEWFSLFTYAVFDGENIFMDNYIEGETEL